MQAFICVRNATISVPLVGYGKMQRCWSGQLSQTAAAGLTHSKYKLLLPYKGRAEYTQSRLHANLFRACGY